MTLEDAVAQALTFSPASLDEAADAWEDAALIALCEVTQPLLLSP